MFFPQIEFRSASGSRRRDPSILWNLVIAALVLLVTDQARAGTIAIPVKPIKDPASDLIVNGYPMHGSEDARHFRNLGGELDLYDPIPSQIWKPEKQEIIDWGPKTYPEDGATFDYERSLPSRGADQEAGTPPEAAAKYRVSYLPSRKPHTLRTSPGLEDFGQKSRTRKYYRLVISLQNHSAIATAAMLRKLGYRVPLPKHYRRLKVRFPDIETRSIFIKEFAAKTNARKEYFVVDEPEGTPILTLQDVMVQTTRLNDDDSMPGMIVRPILFGGSFKGQNTRGQPVSMFRGQRALRALIVPLSLMSIHQESVNIFSWEGAKIQSKHAILFHPFASDFDETTFYDARWIIRRIAKLERHEIESIVHVAKFPQPIAKLLIEKIISRRNDLVEVFGLKREVKVREQRMHFNPRVTVKPHVINGKLKTQKFPGYAGRFSFGDPDMPLTTGDIFKYVLQDGLNFGLQSLLREANENLVFLAMEDHFKDHQEDLISDFQSHLINNPGEPYVTPVKTWGGPIADFDIVASRHLGTGSYYGSDAPVQLVDRIGMQTNLGFFIGVSGIDDVIPAVTANTSIGINYVHVRPIHAEETDVVIDDEGNKEIITPISVAIKENWGDLAVPLFMRSLTEMIEADEALESDLPMDERMAVVFEKFQKFVEQMKEGEQFIISKTVQAGVAGQVNIPIASLLGLEPLSFVNSIVFGAGARIRELDRTTIVRTDTGIQIYRQGLNTKAIEFTIDINYWMNLFRLENREQWGMGHTKVFTLRTDEDAFTEEQKQKLAAAMIGVFRNNNSDVLEAEFPAFQLSHDLHAVIKYRRFLWLNWSRLKEKHTVVLTPLPDTEDPPRYDPMDYQRTLVSNRRLKRSGKNYYNFLSNVMAGFDPNLAFDAGNSGANPAYSFFGESEWTSVTTEAEITPGMETNPVTIVEHHWAGWELDRDDFYELLDDLEGKVADLGLDYRLFKREEFQEMDSIQLFDIYSFFVIYERGFIALKEKLYFDQVGEEEPLLAAVDALWEIDTPDRRSPRERYCQVYKNNRHRHWERRNEREPGQSKWIKSGCIKPWMKDIFEIREEMATEVMNNEDLLATMTEMIEVMGEHVDFKKFTEWLGEENFFYQVRINGFRTEAENALDEDGNYSEYFANSIGMMQPEEPLSIFENVAREEGILTNEIRASYFSEGF